MYTGKQLWIPYYSFGDSADDMTSASERKGLRLKVQCNNHNFEKLFFWGCDLLFTYQETVVHFASFFSLVRAREQIDMFVWCWQW